MVPCLNAIDTAVACLGNHDLDFGVEEFKYLATLCNFSWLCANVLDPALGEEVPLGNCKRTVILTSSNGVQVGFVGVVEGDWLDTIDTNKSELFLRLSNSCKAGTEAQRGRGAHRHRAVSSA